MQQRDKLSSTELVAGAHADHLDNYRERCGQCCFCGRHGSGLPASAAISQEYFNDDDLMVGQTMHVCQYCAYCMDTRTLKQGHWIASADRLEQPSTGDLLESFRGLAVGEYPTPLAVHVTSSPIRSSHAYLWTPVNETATPLTVAYDRQRVRITDWDRFARLVAAIEDLRLHGFTFDEIRSGEPRVRNLQAIGRDAYQERDAVLDPQRRTARLELVLTLSRSADDQPRTDLTDHDPLTP